MGRIGTETLEHTKPNQRIQDNPDHKEAPEDKILRGPVVGACQDDPPLLIGGLKLLKNKQGPNNYLSGIGHDYLTVTVPTHVAEELVQVTTLEEDFYGGSGFGRGERRMCMGGFCDRRYEPYQPSRMYGYGYESWRFSGVTADDPIAMLLDKSCKPTRIDVAFDYSVADDIVPKDVEALIVDHCDRRGLNLTYSGPRHGYTLYVGSRESERMVRVYRRDFKDPTLELEGLSILRVELELKGDSALAYWNHMRTTKSNGFEVAAQHVYDMMGYAPWDCLDEIPPVRRVEDETEAAQMLFQFVHQNAVMLKVMKEYGLDAHQMAEERLRMPSKVQKSRIRRKLLRLSSVPPERLQRMVEQMLRPKLALE